MNSIQYRTRVRVAMIPLNYSNRDKADVNELMIDRDNGSIYINTSSGIRKYPDKDSVYKDTVDSLKDRGITKNDSISLGDIISNSDSLSKWVLDRKTSDGVRVGTDDIFRMVRDIRSTETFMGLMYNKVDKVVGKDLVSNNFTNFYKNKLSSIDKGAGIYKHPKTQICNYVPQVTSVNGMTGAISIYKDNIDGLENAEMNANNYVHPDKQQCMHSFTIQEVNGISEKDITLDKKDLGLSRVSNMKLLSYEDIHNNDIGYVKPRDLVQYIDYLLEEV